MPRFSRAVLALARTAWQRFVQALFTMDRRTTLLVCSLLFVAIAIVDYVTPPQLNLTFAYVLGILLATWNLGARAGAAYALLASAVQFAMLMQLQAEALPHFSVYWNVILINRLFTFFVVVGLTAPLRKLYDHEHRQARVDALTGAVNRQHFLDLLTLEIARSRRSGEPFSVAYLDCDGLKAVNDRLGHHEGDALLKSLVACVRHALRITDVVARLGGDEFAILFPQTEGSRAIQALERIRADLRRTFEAHGWRSSLSVGAATFRKPAQGSEQIVAACDALMYRAKADGKDRVVYELVA
ncbi:MAG TPA: GGDEF domain-containing protein [Burkholderiales bacterium]|nr:GGDEF domain-containing protein [Burkholderiales bacterium]